MQTLLLVQVVYDSIQAVDAIPVPIPSKPVGFSWWSIFQMIGSGAFSLLIYRVFSEMIKWRIRRAELKIADKQVDHSQDKDQRDTAIEAYKAQVESLLDRVKLLMDERKDLQERWDQRDERRELQYRELMDKGEQQGQRLAEMSGKLAAMDERLKVADEVKGALLQQLETSTKMLELVTAERDSLKHEVIQWKQWADQRDEEADELNDRLQACEGRLGLQGRARPPTKKSNASTDLDQRNNQQMG